jgi:CBS domain-containing protein
MEQVSLILKEKGGVVRTILAERSVTEAAIAIEEHKVGALLVMKENKPAGILSERDIVTRVVSKGLNPKAVKVEEVMTKDLVVISLDTSIREAMAIMTHRKCRHLPVMDGDKLAGLISIGDLNRFFSKDYEYTIRHMQDYIQGNLTR